MQVEVVRSARRRKTVEARMVGGVMQLSIPARMTKAEEQHWIEVMSKRLARRRAGDAVDLTKRARALARRYRLPEPDSIRWVDNQNSRWGSCTPSTKTIRLSSRMVGFPAFVIDHVILHELAHLVHLDHGPGFQAIVDQDPLKERVTGYLMAKSHDAADGAGGAEGAQGDQSPDEVDGGPELIDDGTGQLRIA